MQFVQIGSINSLRWEIHTECNALAPLSAFMDKPRQDWTSLWSRIVNIDSNLCLKVCYKSALVMISELSGFTRKLVYIKLQAIQCRQMVWTISSVSLFNKCFQFNFFLVKSLLHFHALYCVWEFGDFSISFLHSLNCCNWYILPIGTPKRANWTWESFWDILIQLKNLWIASKFQFNHLLNQVLWEARFGCRYYIISFNSNSRTWSPTCYIFELRQTYHHICEYVELKWWISFRKGFLQLSINIFVLLLQCAYPHSRAQQLCTIGWAYNCSRSYQRPGTLFLIKNLIIVAFTDKG